MPANPKYLSSRWSRVGKIIAAILGGFAVTTAVHMAVGSVLEDKSALILTSIYSSWLMWAALMIWAFTFQKARHVLALYFGITLLVSVFIYFVK